VLAFHGGGGNSTRFARSTAPGGDVEAEGALHNLAAARGWVTVYGNGTPNPNDAEVRTWNAGGGVDGYACVSGLACAEGVDDIAYTRALLDALRALLPVDDRRVFATGMSNGAALCHRLACEAADLVAAIAAVGGGNQLIASGAKPPVRTVPLLQIHGTEDHAWPYNSDQNANGSGEKWISIARTISWWASAYGCAAPARRQQTPLDPSDPTRVQLDTYRRVGADAVLVFYLVVRGGHTWPGGFSVLPEERAGTLSRNLIANDVILDFFQTHA